MNTAPRTPFAPSQQAPDGAPHAGRTAPARRRLLTAAIATAATAGAVAALHSVPATAAPATGATGQGQLPGTTRVLGHTVDISRATPRTVGRLARYFTDKTNRDVDATVAHFTRDVTYVDAILGWSFTWQPLKDMLGQIMPTWPATAESYPVKILGDSSGAVVLFVDSPELFGHELRPLGFVDFRDGRITRWVDYWDGRQLTLEDIAEQRTPADQFPEDFGEGIAGENAAPALRRTAHALAAALASGDVDAAVALFGADGVFEDMVLHTKVTGPIALRAYLTRALPSLPYGPGTRVRHVVGGALGGGYEWTRATGPVRRGATALELDPDGRITHLTAVWDGSLVPEAELNRLQSLTIES
ncbi:nuclear transport factor 2 family protein [Streptomyces sp. NPDC048290]|uniref:nuclear transport factor 2 family protein n=1 Tax=Streptomyces sp. NPDC048290 TaxID=3155811 RepID=UPI00344A1FA2